jgi:hypothetical protein
MDNVLILIDDSKFNHGCGDTHLSASASMNAWSPACVRPHYAAGVTGAAGVVCAEATPTAALPKIPTQHAQRLATPWLLDGDTVAGRERLG